MICETCHGKGRTLRMFSNPICYDCGGTGFAHCCEGHNAACDLWGELWDWDTLDLESGRLERKRPQEPQRTREQEAWGEWRRR